MKIEQQHTVFISKLSFVFGIHEFETTKIENDNNKRHINEVVIKSNRSQAPEENVTYLIRILIQKHRLNLDKKVEQ